MSFLIDLGIKSAAILSLAFLAAFAMRRASASARYAMWTCALASLLLLPAALRIGPRISLPINPAAMHSAPTDTTPPTSSISVVVQATRPAIVPWPAAIWIAGILAMLMKIAIGHWRVRSLFGAAEQIHDPHWLALAAATAASLGLRRRIILKRTSATDVPLGYGLFHATILLPADADQWTEERRRIVLAHEMIHARRFDLSWGLLAQCAVAANWFNPLAWLAAKQLRREQERSCDDAVIMAGTAPTVYAAHLVNVARAIAIPGAALGMADRFDLEGRVHALLDPRCNRHAAGRKLCLAMLTAAVALTMPLAAIRAQQASRASISGSVLDPSRAVIPRATISFKNTTGSNEEAATADLAGAYKLAAIPAGDYLVKVSAPGFAPFQKSITLAAGSSTSMNFSLELGSIQETVQIFAKRPLSNVSSVPAAPQKIRVGGNVQPIKLVSKVSPAYPADAQAEGVEGTVLLRAVVSKTGSLLHVTPISDVDPRLISAAVAAVSLWQYEPTLLNGEPVEAITTITVQFRLN